MRNSDFLLEILDPILVMDLLQRKFQIPTLIIEKSRGYRIHHLEIRARKVGFSNCNVI